MRRVSEREGNSAVAEEGGALKAYFERQFGRVGSAAYVDAQECFMKSLAGYSVACYILQLKDRHNGNILIDREGHLIHIDFGFILGKTPGGNIGFEAAPFKLTADFVALLGGMNSALFHRYRDTCVTSFGALRRESHRIILSLEMLIQGADHLPCFFGDPTKTLMQLTARLLPGQSDRAAAIHMNRLIDEAADNWTTNCYDRYQRCCVGIF